MKKHYNDFGNDSVPGLVLRTSIPFMFAQFVNVLYSIVDRIYIGNIPQIGDVSLAGAGICAPIITLLSSFATLIGIGGSVLFSIRLGAKDQEKAKNLLGTSFSMLLVFSAALTILPSGRPGAFAIKLITSIRKPSTPRSNQRFIMA